MDDLGCISADGARIRTDYKTDFTARVNVGYAEAIPQFNGNGNFSEWIRKLELVARSQAIKDPENFLPLFLTGRAFTVYESLSQRSKDDYEEIKHALTRAFSIDCFRAYENFAARKLLPGEEVELYLADLTRLGRLAVRGGVSDDLLKCAFVAGLPEAERRSLKAGCMLESMSLDEVVERARIVVSTSMRENVCAAAARRKFEYSRPLRVMRCTVCNQEGHLRRQCPNRVIRRCFICDSDEHLVRNCPERVSKNDQGSLPSAPADSQIRSERRNYR